MGLKAVVAYNQDTYNWELININGVYDNVHLSANDFIKMLTDLGRRKFPRVIDIEVREVTWHKGGPSDIWGTSLSWTPSKPLPVMPALEESNRANIKVLEANIVRFTQWH